MTCNPQPRAPRAGLGRISEAARAVGCLLITLALLARALVPAGYMPEVDARTGEITVAMCSGHGEHQTIVFQLPGQPSKQNSQRKDCPFASTVTSVAYQSQALPVPTLVQYRHAVLPVQTPSPTTAVRRPSAPPTGPPAFA